jgi:ribosomal protein S18 acetylase RimI-like enzyme
MYLVYLLKQFLYRVDDSLDRFKEEGIRVGLAQLGRTSARMLHQRADYVVMANTLAEFATRPEPRSGLVIRQAATPEEIAKLSPIADSADIARFYKLIENGSTAFAAYHNDQVVGYCWASGRIDQSVNRVQAALRLRPGDAYTHDLFISPSYRGRGLGRSLLSHCLRYLGKCGYKRTVAAVQKDNIPSLKLTKKIGYEIIGELHHTRTLFWDHFECNVPE